VQELLGNPAVQSSVVPFLAGLLVAGLLFPLRLGGLAAAAGLVATVTLVGDFTLEPLDGSVASAAASASYRSPA